MKSHVVIHVMPHERVGQFLRNLENVEIVVLQVVDQTMVLSYGTKEQTDKMVETLSLYPTQENNEFAILQEFGYAHALYMDSSAVDVAIFVYKIITLAGDYFEPAMKELEEWLEYHGAFGA